MHLLLQITITKRYKLNTTIIYTKMTNSNNKKEIALKNLKRFHNDGTKKFDEDCTKKFKKVL